ncbi:MAG: hypothetical protein ACYC2R_15240 [Burkholderiales bacterium]
MEERLAGVGKKPHIPAWPFSLRLRAFAVNELRSLEPNPASAHAPGIFSYEKLTKHFVTCCYINTFLLFLAKDWYHDVDNL